MGCVLCMRTQDVEQRDMVFYQGPPPPGALIYPFGLSLRLSLLLFGYSLIFLILIFRMLLNLSWRKGFRDYLVYLLEMR